MHKVTKVWVTSSDPRNRFKWCTKLICAKPLLATISIIFWAGAESSGGPPDYAPFPSGEVQSHPKLKVKGSRSKCPNTAAVLLRLSLSLPPPPIHTSAISRHWDKTSTASLGQFGIEIYTIASYHHSTDDTWPQLTDDLTQWSHVDVKRRFKNIKHSGTL